MIEVITYAECVIRIHTKEDIEQSIRNELLSLPDCIVTEEVVSISKPSFNTSNGCLETQVLARFVLNIPEEAQEKKNVEEYVEDIVPFLKRYVPKCNDVVHTKIIQMKRVLEP
ncbi:hypothetical protein [Radiobacillus deserti]|uniref:Uncharacterized protein n=1 Tax=Radiobacillus deserti TaxID=2594883 RepID=A0A516KKL7_9BACI|nr:hypothetical protein [Radiobacillus deserti]QDP41926.1 hypothetical protein FN924_18155 [Radiobacillus deserti]